MSASAKEDTDDAPPKETGGEEVAATGTAADTATPSDAANDASSKGDDAKGSADKDSPYSLTDQEVLKYLKSRGMTTAAMELEQILDPKEGDAQNAATPKNSAELREQLKKDDVLARNQRAILTRSTGGGYGYDRDAAAPILQWGVPDVTTQKILKDKDGRDIPPKLGMDESQAYMNAFVSLQLWVLSLPDDHIGGHIQPKTHDPIGKAKTIIDAARSDPSKEVSLASIVKEMTTPHQTKRKTIKADDSFTLPPSAKPELLAVTFALLVHTYCELLEVGMESTAHVLRDAFQPVYDPIYGQEFVDLFKCTTTEDMMKLNSYNSQHLDSLVTLKTIISKIKHCQTKKEELQRANISDASSKQAKNKIQEFEQHIATLRQKYTESSLRATTAFDRMHDLPFLRRARAIRWQITLSSTSYGMLASFLNNTTMNESLLAMSSLLQTKCELHVERRDPLPFTPACILDDNRLTKQDPNNLYVRIDAGVNEGVLINWAAPLPRRDDTMDDEDLPFPKFHLEDEYDDERSARYGKRAVEYNRALLVNGFRRLEALERKRGFEVMSAFSSSADSSATTIANPLEPSVLLSTLCANKPGASDSSPKSNPERKIGSSGPAPDASAIWNEPGVGICCAKASQPDGRFVAAGCDDSAVRIWNLKDQSSNNQTMGEPAQVLLGHKNGFPVFSVDWNRDGRTLLSAGGDGSIRLWDAQAQGPFGDVGKPTRSKSKTAAAITDDTQGAIKANLEKATTELNAAKDTPSMSVPGFKAETNPYTCGAALAVYRGHAPNAPVWSVAFSPSGYYFASAGGDATARLWTTDRGAPVRVFTGHTSNCINSVVFHPNCNYILTGADDKTARLWDIQTGSCVRLLNGCSKGVSEVKVSPCGKYAAGSDYSGIVHLWDLGTGKKVSQLQAKRTDHSTQSPSMVHSLAFSSCGSALATGGDDCCVRIWDVKDLQKAPPVMDTPVKSFSTRRTILLDLNYTKRNLLLSVGKYATAFPTATTIAD